MADQIASNPKVLLWGAKSKARIIDEMLRESGQGIAHIIFDSTLTEPAFHSTATFTNDIHKLKAMIKQVTHYIACIGGEHGYARYMTAHYLEKLGLLPITLMHHKSFAEPTASIGSGCQMMPFSVVHKFSSVGEQTILNTSCTVDHECMIGKGVHIMGNAAIAGQVEIGDYATIGTNATILPGIKIGEGAFVGAGAVVNKDVAPYTVVAGVPAKLVRKHKTSFDKTLLQNLTGVSA